MIVSNYKSKPSQQPKQIHTPNYSLSIINYQLNYGDYHHEYT